MNDHRRPQAFHIDPAPKPDKVRRPPRAIPVSKIKFDDEAAGQDVVVVPPAPLPSSRTLRWGALLVSTLFGLFVMWAGLSVTSLIEELFQRSQYLGWIGLGLAGLAGLAALAIILREIWGLARLNRIEHVQADAARALNHDDDAAAKRVMSALKDIYRHRPDAAWGLKSLAEHESDVMDAKDRVRLIDRDLVSAFDEETHRIIARRSRRVTMLTAVTPAAALDILFVAAQNLRMLREIATLYGGRPSVLATFRLARMVVSHLAVAGGLALSDSLIQHVVGKGLIGRLSARFGEGAVNGILTARIGLAARDVCRPIPQEAEAKETLAGLTRELLNFSNEAERNAAPRLDLAIRRSHDVRNAVHTVILIGGSALLLAFIAWTVFSWTGLVWAALLGAFGLWSMGRVSPKMVLGLYKARPLKPDELPEVHDVIHKLARRAELPSVPQLYYVPSKVLNAFAVGKPEESAIAVTDGLLRAMTMRQLAGILAHETSHIRSGDLKVMALADVLTRVTSTMAIMGLIGIPALFGAGIDIPWLGILLLIFAPTLGGLLQLGLSRTREYDADLDGAALTGDPTGLASALETLERRQGHVWEGLFPAGRVPSPSLLRTHPATKDRVARLLSLTGEAQPQIVVTGAKPAPGPSLVPPIRNPRIHWQRMGIWY